MTKYNMTRNTLLILLMQIITLFTLNAYSILITLLTLLRTLHFILSIRQQNTQSCINIQLKFRQTFNANIFHTIYTITKFIRTKKTLLTQLMQIITFVTLIASNLIALFTILRTFYLILSVITFRYYST
ncbi:hypothetical protein IMG5_185970 [Ichthyophthirius multifiliis]|uniref:Transmembrane protein n=1 Tax=Ichthyophthirius multifiliis TaxID=5932 RepID=G0R3K7_ICHMU|nr:hypothetical protein IMG5_185970 [Ichthyophthirius multifiliis]EGR27948.1 hypothetical protein IMG5_185970 [Ichthyophthirius multifiliis]|eukprot:XP_004027293.1 hypothetical protein IMG5_185970 [Ichthyophthirius multifiliis]